MKPVTVGRYKPVDETGPVEFESESDWLGWIETEDWIVYEHEDGRLFVFVGRDPDTGAVVGEPTIV